MRLIAERSEASNPGRTTEMGVVLYGSPSSFLVYIYMCTHKSQNFSSPRSHFMIGPTLKSRFRVRLQMSLRTIRASDQTTKKMLHEVSSPHLFVL